MTLPSRKTGFLAFAAVGFASCGLSGFVASQGGTPPPTKVTPEGAAFFETKVRPLLVASCVPCHGGGSPMGGVRLDTAEGFRKGGPKGPFSTDDDPEKSLLVHVVRYTGPVNMPPSGKLKPSQIADLETWVKMGAPWPAGELPKRPQDAPLWSLRPVRKPVVPRPKNAAWVRNPIDAFVLAKLDAKGLRPAASVDRRALLRRVTYDLTGLPPTAGETDAFLADKRSDAYDRIVDRLLASPRYGERWARSWLDVARYADTKGYVFVEDRNYPNAYTYRAWVIKALNDDLPYDRFVTAQLAADRLPETQGDDKTALAALGFLTLGRRFLNDTPSIIDDRIDVTMRGFQGFTVACARCHDHKFDPIPTQDYYSLYGVFASSDERTVAISPKPVRDPWEAYSARVTENERAIRELVLAQISKLRAAPPEGAKGALQSLGVGTVAEGDELKRLLPFFDPGERERLMRLIPSLDLLRKSPPAMPEFAMAMADAAHPGDGVVFKRGNPGNHGEAAPRRFLKALSSGEREHWTAGSGRLELAKAIASKENPLTARVFVNRVWQGHFGAGLVRTPSDFGHQGEPPTHPELLDWLASTFMEGGWSIKRLHRLIVLSSTYRQASDPLPATLAADPDNRLLGRMNRRRLDLESMRDSLMAAAGKLDVGSVGGPSVDLWSRPYTGRRAVYGFVERQNLPGIFRTFDFASPDSTSARRFFTTVPQQALFFLNSPFVVEEARALASRTEVATAKDDPSRVRRLYRLLFARLPDAAETAAGVAYLKRGDPGAVRGDWQYGYGGLDDGRVAFNPFGAFADGSYRASGTFPDPSLGYVSLNSAGGHPGRDAGHAAIRRWIAPAMMTISIRGVVKHPSPNGDGVRARIVSNRGGILGEWRVRHGEARAEVKDVSVGKGDTIDFIVDPVEGDNSDGYAWTPTIVSEGHAWDASSGFAPPPPPPLSRLTLYAQALLMTDEFLFVD